MSTVPPSTTSFLRSPGRRVRANDSTRRPVELDKCPSAVMASYVGRVGALAVALGVGSAVVALPLAFADSTGSDGSTANAVEESSSSNPSSSNPSSSNPSRATPSRGGSRSVTLGGAALGSGGPSTNADGISPSEIRVR